MRLGTSTATTSVDSTLNFGSGGPGGTATNPGASGQASQKLPAGSSGTTDFDDDGITDSSDTCVEIARGTDTNGDGCPDRPTKLLDTDGDDVPDNFDACPTVATSTENGCPPDTTAPTATGKPTGTRVSPTANVTATFSEAMNEASVEKTNASGLPTTFTLKKKGTTRTLAATVVYSEPTATTFKATLNPSSNLRAGATYTATVSSVATDLAGNALDQDPNIASNQPKSWKFTIQ